MLEQLGIAVLKTLVSFIFGQMLNASHVKVEGAPEWFGRSYFGHFCVSTVSEGGYGAVEEAKEKLYTRMERELRRLIRKGIYENFRDVSDPKEIRFLEAVAEGRKLNLFVEGYMRVKNVEYDEDRGIAFARGCVSKEDFEKFFRERMRELRKELSIRRAEDAFRELESTEEF